MPPECSNVSKNRFNFWKILSNESFHHSVLLARSKRFFLMIVWLPSIVLMTMTIDRGHPRDSKLRVVIITKIALERGYLSVESMKNLPCLLHDLLYSRKENTDALSKGDKKQGKRGLRAPWEQGWSRRMIVQMRANLAVDNNLLLFYLYTCCYYHFYIYIKKWWNLCNYLFHLTMNTCFLFPYSFLNTSFSFLFFFQTLCFRSFVLLFILLLFHFSISCHFLLSLSLSRSLVMSFT